MVTLALAAVAVAKNAIPTSAATFRVRFEAVPLYESRCPGFNDSPGYPVSTTLSRLVISNGLNG